MPYKIAGVDVHEKMLAVVVSDVEVAGEYQFERRMVGSNPEQLRSLAAWLLEQEVEEVVLESTAHDPAVDHVARPNRLSRVLSSWPDAAEKRCYLCGDARGRS